jgi:hypothetical protein
MKLSPLQWLVLDDISEFRHRLKWAIQRYRDFHLEQWTAQSGLLSDEHPLPVLSLDEVLV